MNKEISLHNGKFISEFSVGAENRAFRYGDGIFETIRVSHGKILWYRYHHQRLLTSLKLLKLDAHPDFEKDKLYDLLNQLLTKNKIHNGGRIRLSVYRNEGGLYTPSTNASSYLVEVIPFKNNDYQLNEQGLHMAYFKDHRKASTQLSRIKTSNSLVYVLASLFAKEKNYDDAIIYNQEGRIAESTHSNVWIVKDGKIITPNLSEGALYGVMRRVILSNKTGSAIVNELDLSICEGKLTKEDLEEAEEIFLSNAIQGIQWVKKLGRKSYSNERSKEIIRIINEFAKAD